MSLRHVARLIEARELSPVELTETMLDRIAEVDGRLKRYATVMRVQAMAAARAAETEIQGGRDRGPLHGVPIAVKDLCYTRAEPLEPVLGTLDGGVGGVRLGIDRRYTSEGVDPASARRP